MVLYKRLQNTAVMVVSRYTNYLTSYILYKKRKQKKSNYNAHNQSAFSNRTNIKVYDN